ncbi:hypothetical protein OIU84_029611 [Salix udensis]|uniref:Uncharacterized protein n=1 Tax=Salix udensis TaxID=889485 RepID=A0AAD6KC32_9ROSI|nr:hypothetical protein OIU84_029611 [Salix udensis]
MKTPGVDGEAEEEVVVVVVVVSGRSAGKKLKQNRRRRKKTSIWIHISHEIRCPSIVRSSPCSNMGERRGGW